MLGLTSLGLIHTAISLVAVASGAVALVRDRRISITNSLGKTYIYTTILTCITGFGIFEHGGFGKPHALGIMTLVVLGLAMAAELKHAFGRTSSYVAVIGYSLTFFFHIIPGFTETATRLPPDAPLAASDADPKLLLAIGMAFLVFLIGGYLQFRSLRSIRL